MTCSGHDPSWLQQHVRRPSFLMTMAVCTGICLRLSSSSDRADGSLGGRLQRSTGIRWLLWCGSQLLSAFGTFQIKWEKSRDPDQAGGQSLSPWHPRGMAGWAGMGGGSGWTCLSLPPQLHVCPDGCVTSKAPGAQARLSLALETCPIQCPSSANRD